ncbi:MAG: hypothetical protein IJ244_03785, partial [Bacteroidaceae bacterium]|nr:hypothetical protein [Bacteroidaceae bacterium]
SIFRHFKGDVLRRGPSPYGISVDTLEAMLPLSDAKFGRSWKLTKNSLTFFEEDYFNATFTMFSASLVYSYFI